MKIQMKVGMSVCDAHNGVNSVQFYTAHQHTRIRVDGAYKMVQQVLDFVGIERTYINKYVVIVDAFFDDGVPTYKGIYSYDDRYFGIVYYRESEQ